MTLAKYDAIYFCSFSNSSGLSKDIRMSKGTLIVLSGDCADLSRDDGSDGCFNKPFKALHMAEGLLLELPLQ